MDLAAALTREHREIDGGIEEFRDALDRGTSEAERLRATFAALRRHIYLEEELLFPPIREAGMMMPILVMISEHGTLWRLMDSIESRLDGGDSGWLREACDELLAHLVQHNLKEEPIVYPRASTDLVGGAGERLAEFLRTGSAPAGWVCEGAREQ